jgi:type IV pilus assembly protein PilP
MMQQRMQNLLLALLSAAFVVHCDDAPTGQSKEPWPQENNPTASAPTPAPAAPVEEVKEVAGVTIDLKEADFTEGPTNRDPFRSFISQFAQPTRRVVDAQHKTILPRYSMDELKLIAVVTGGTRPRAMFRDPTGLGVLVQRGDYISKSSSKIKQILFDKVIVEVTKQAEDKSTQSDQIIELHDEEELKNNMLHE